MIQRRQSDVRSSSPFDQARFEKSREATLLGNEDTYDGKWIALTLDGTAVVDCDGNLERLTERLQSTHGSLQAFTFEHFLVDDASTIGGAELH